MTNAETLKNTWKYFTSRAKKEQAKHLLENCKNIMFHEIGKLKCFKLNGHIEVINAESLVLKFFDTEQEAVDYCLDFYHDIKINEQTTIFGDKT